ncbi:MAG TPA: molybdopterin-dependent oxidoreductase [Candidatus Baltobacteraceae bacterium]|nr:molybdopterin-dependent oxidoreductase [Candidatus Baltobacteraceae bacterium]
MSGFVGKHRASDGGKLPPGQYETHDFPVLSAGPTPAVPVDTWEFSLVTETGATRVWNWQQFRALPSEKIETDIHCVTRWSKFGTHWEGVSIDTLLRDVETSAGYAMAHSYGGYSTNVPLPDLRGGKAWIAFGFGGKDLEPEHGGPARLLVPHLYFWKSAKWVNGLTLMRDDEPGFWEQLGYNMYGDPWREQRYTGD